MNYNSMKARKVSKKSYDNIEISRSTTKKASRTIKRIRANWLIVFIVLIISIAGGFFAHNFVFKNDIYEMIAVNGEIDIIIGGDENSLTTYTEPGVKCIAFGKDYSKDCTVKYYYRSDLTQTEIETTIDQINSSNEGIYYAVYECPATKFASVKLIRNIIVLGGEDNG